MSFSSARPPSLLALPSYVISQVARFGYRHLEACLVEHDLQLGHHAVLAALNDFGPLSQQQLADRLYFDKSHLVGRIDHLEERGLVVRAKDPTDRRRHRVEMTAEGAAMLKTLNRDAQRSQDQFLEALTKVEQRTLLELARRVLDANDASRLDTGQGRVPHGAVTL